MRNSPKQPFAIDQVIFQGEDAIFNTLLGGPEGAPIEQGRTTVEEWTRRFVEAARGIPARTLGLMPENFPLRALHTQNNFLLFLLEYPPGVRTLAWTREGVKPKGVPEPRWREATVALPYVLFFITVQGGRYLGKSSVYFRNERIRAADFTDTLSDCHFFNCSPQAYGVYCWMCSTSLPPAVQPTQSLPAFVASVIDNFWFTGFNYSSEHNEGNSFFGLGRKGGKKQIPDARVQTIEAWEEATARDPGFAVTVPWNPSPRTVRDVFAELTAVGSGSAWPFRTAGDLGNLIVGNKPPDEPPDAEGAFNE